MTLGVIAIICAVASAAIGAVTGAFCDGSWLYVLPVSFLACFIGMLAVIFLVIWTMCQVVDLEKPQEKDSPVYRKTTYFIIRLILPILQVRMHIEGMEKVPADRRILLVSNHLNDMDPVLLLYFFRKNQIAFISKRENSTMFLVGKLMHKIMCQLINRENDREALKTILKCVQLLKDDEVSIGVFPEGYTSLDGLLHPFRHGVFKIAQKAQVPIVVCTLRNTQYIFKNAKRLKPTDVYLNVLKVIPAEELKGITAVEVGNRVHKLMADDLGPELVLKPKKETP